ncbi:S-layer homology domain-containing protein [Paenibacillus gorillae]|uniref:S-layer homology domain-containing protein n=1 Tax=Paenibacillus gorillae TaxID=1243662 RepID=UPI0004AF20E7|nr:S-layer homology domain-containing protein [Paenibacillus gorillae]
MLAMLLLLTSMPIYGAAAEAPEAGTEGQQLTVEADDTALAASLASGASYVRLKNRWQNNYLYEDSNGIVRYGFTNITNESSHWQVEDYNGNKRLKNRETGHYLTMAEVSKRRDAVTSREITASAATDQWSFHESNRPGFIVIKSASAPSASNLVLHVEDQLGFAEVSSDINITFESPQWKLEPVSELLPIRIGNQYRDGQYLYEDRTDGSIKYGPLSAADPSSHWYLETTTDGSGGEKVRFRNRDTGHYVVQGTDLEAVLLASSDGSSANSEWNKLSAGNNFYNFTSANPANPAAYILHAEAGGGKILSNTGVQLGWGSAQWKIELAHDIVPVRIVNFTTEKIGTSYWYEDQGQLKFGPLGQANVQNKSYQWLVEDNNGAKQFRNAGTGNYVALPVAEEGAGLKVAESAPETPTEGWIITDSTIYDDYKSFRSVTESTYYAHKADDSDLVLGGVTDPETDAAQWLLEDLNVSTDGTLQYVRISSVWQNMFLYEDDAGRLKYGNPKADDQSSHWLIEKFNGRKRIQNRETGHYINLDPNGGGIKVTEVEDENNGAIWVIKDLGGPKLINSVLDKNNIEGQQKFINLQGLTKYAEYSVINPAWSSPRWTFVPVSDAMPSYIRLKSKDSGQYLYEVTEPGADLGKVKNGNVGVENKASVWFVEGTDAADQFRLKNLSTGQYITMEDIGAGEDAPDKQVNTYKDICLCWGSAKWKLQTSDSEGFINIVSAWDRHILYTAGDYTKISRLVASQDAAKFAIEAVTVEQPLPEEAIRIKNSANGQYLYENKGGIIMYGAIQPSNGYSHWFIQDVNGRKQIVNRVTGHVLTTQHDYTYITAEEPAADSAAQSWSIENAPAQGSYLVRSLNGSYNDEYLNVQNSAGYVERGLYPDSFGSLQWKLEQAPEQFETPEMGEARNDVTSTPIFSDTHYINIVSKVTGELLVEQNGTVSTQAVNGSSSAAQWLLQEYNGRKLLQNRQSGRYLSAELTTSALEAGNNLIQWTLNERGGYVTASSAADGSGVLTDSASGTSYGVPATADASLWKLNPIAADVIYEAEEAFIAGGVAVKTTTAGFSGEGYADGFTAVGGKIAFTVNAQAAGNYETAVRYNNASAEAKRFNVYVNGLPSGHVELPAAQGWSTAELDLALRSGINTVSLQVDGAGDGGAAIDYLIVKNSVGKAFRGATLPYITYEAEHGKTNGTLIEPSRLYKEVASEASGRQAVTLANTGEYVEFETAEAANALTLRFSMPDSSDGTGINASLGLYVNGELRERLSLTSKHAWEYGSYPWSNDPSQGSPHRFFDEAHVLIGDVPAGSVIRLQKDAADTADYYTIDLIDLEQVADAFAQPANFLSVTDFGAVAGDGNDDTAALLAAITAAKAQGKGVWFPQGIFHFTGDNITLDQITIRGSGMWHTTLIGARFIGQGTNIQVYDLLIDGELNIRDDEASTHAFEGAFGKGSVIQNVWVEHSKTGLWLTKVKNRAAGGDVYFDEITDGLHMVGLRLRNLMADGINFCVGTQDSMMEQSDIRYPGDDGIAMWSFLVPSINNTARFNTVSLPWLADNIVVFGGHGNKIQDNVTSDTITNGAGIAVSTRFNPVPFTGTTIVERNTLIRNGSYDTGYQVNLGAIWIFAGEKDLDGEVIVRNNTALDSTYSGLVVHGDFRVDKVKLIDNVLDGMGTSGVEVTKNVKGSIEVDNVIVRGERISPVTNSAEGFAFKEINEGFASILKPFHIDFGGSSGKLTLKAGASRALVVLKANGDNVTPQAAIAAGNSSIASVSGGNIITGVTTGTTTIAITVDGTTRTYTLSVIPADGNGGNGSGPGTGSGGGSVPVDNNADTSANDSKLKNALKDNPSTVSFTAGANGVSFSVQALLEAEKSNPNAIIVVENGGAAYRFPLSQVDKALKEAGITATANAVWTFAVNQLTEAALSELRKHAAEAGLELKGSPVDFSITVKAGDRTVQVTSFGGIYVARTIIVDGKLDSSKTTALVYDSSTGQFRYVPALFESISGDKTLVTIKSVSNSIYVIASYSKTYADIAGHWAKADIELLSAKRILNGASEDRFEPNKAVTRAEFAAMLVRSLGLPQQAGDAVSAPGFKDVKGSEWFAPAVASAVKYGLLKGYDDGTFKPNRTISREEMAVMAANALKLFGQAQSQGAGESSAAAGTFTDANTISAWAAESVKLAVSGGIMNGIKEDVFSPKENSTRAQAAVILKRLLQSLELLNK